MDNELQTVNYATSIALRVYWVDWLAAGLQTLQGLDGLQ